MKNTLKEINPDNRKFYIKILIIGTKEVGKTQILNGICKKDFQTEYNPTFGMDFCITKYKDINPSITFQIIEIGGKFPPPNDVIKNYVIDTDCFLCVYDASKESTLKKLEKIIIEFKSFIPNDNKEQFWYFIRNKCDPKETPPEEIDKNFFENLQLTYIKHIDFNAKLHNKFTFLLSDIIEQMKNFMRFNTHQNEETQLDIYNEKNQKEKKDGICVIF